MCTLLSPQPTPHATVYLLEQQQRKKNRPGFIVGGGQTGRGVTAGGGGDGHTIHQKPMHKLATLHHLLHLLGVEGVCVQNQCTYTEEPHPHAS